MLCDKLHKQIVRKFGIDDGNAHEEIVSHLRSDCFFQIGNILLNLFLGQDHFTQFHAGGIVCTLDTGAAPILRSLLQATHNHPVKRAGPGRRKSAGEFGPHARFQNLAGIPRHIAAIVGHTVRHDKRRHLHGAHFLGSVLIIVFIQLHIKRKLILGILLHHIGDILCEAVII